MSEISNVNASNFGYYVKHQPSFGRQETAACRYYNCEEQPDSFESSEKKSNGEKAAIATVIALPITVATLWLTKGKIKNLFKPKAPKDVIPRKKYTKPGLEIRENIRNEDSGLITRNANNKSRNLVDQANLDTPTPGQQAAYDRQIAYKAPTEEEAKIIKQINANANKKTAINHQVRNNIPDAQRQNLEQVRKNLDTPIVDRKKLTGLFKTKDGFTVKLEGGNIKEITTPDGRVITKLKTIDKYQDKIDMSNLKAVK